MQMTGEGGEDMVGSGNGVTHKQHRHNVSGWYGKGKQGKDSMILV